MSPKDGIRPTASALCKSALDADGVVLLVPGLLEGPGLHLVAVHRLRQLLSLASRPEISARENSDATDFNSQMIGLENLAMASLQPTAANNCAAYLTYQAEFPLQLNTNVLRADPAYQQIDMNNATLADPSLVQLSAEESNGFIETLNEHFAQDGISFEFAQPNRWYCHFKELPMVNTVSFTAAVGHDVTACRPVGVDTRRWRSKLAEIEMLLFEHPVNEARQARGELPVNTLWLWGEGDCENSLTVPELNIVSDDFYTQSLASHCKLAHQSLTDLENTKGNSALANKALLLVVNKFAANAATGDTQAFEKELLWVEEFIAKMLWSNLKKTSGWPVIVIWCGGTQFFKVDASVKNKFWRKAWRKPSPLSAFSVASEHLPEMPEA